MSLHKKKQIKDLLMSTKHLRRRRPKVNMIPQDEERKVYRLDLFFDLVFVVAIGQIAHMFHGDITWRVILQFVILFTPVWWIWVNSVYYVERYEELTIRHRIYMFAMMVPILGIAYSVHGAFEELAPWYVGSYVLARLLLWRVWNTANRNQKQSKSLQVLARNISRMNVVVALLWLCSLLLPEPWRYVLWFATMGGELIYTYTLRDLNDDSPPLHFGHLTERFGLFTIVVLAEIIIGVFSGLSEVHYLNLRVIITSIGAFIIACLLRRIYFDQIMYRPMKPEDPRNTFLRTYAHLPMTMGITALGGTLSHIINMAGDHLEKIPVVVVVGSLCLVLLMIGYLAQFHEARDINDVIDFGDDDHFNQHLRESKLTSIVLLILRGGVTIFFHLPVWWFIVGVVILLSGLALESLLHWLMAQSDEHDHDAMFHHSHGHHHHDHT